MSKKIHRLNSKEIRRYSEDAKRSENHSKKLTLYARCNCPHDPDKIRILREDDGHGNLGSSTQVICSICGQKFDLAKSKMDVAKFEDCVKYISNMLHAVKSSSNSDKDSKEIAAIGDILVKLEASKYLVSRVMSNRNKAAQRRNRHTAAGASRGFTSMSID